MKDAVAFVGLFYCCVSCYGRDRPSRKPDAVESLELLSSESGSMLRPPERGRIGNLPPSNTCY